MAVNVTIKSNYIFKKQFDIKDVLVSNMRYGIIEYVKYLAEKMHVKEFIREDEFVTFDQIPFYVQLDANTSTNALKEIEENVDNGTYENMYIFGAINPITLGKKELSKIEGNIEKLGELMHSLQSIDAYYAAPRVYQKKDESIFGMYVLTGKVCSIFPYRAKLFMADTNINVDDWYINFVVDGNMVGIIPYEDFVKSVKEKEEYDTEHFIVTLNKEQIENLVSQYKVEL